MILVRLFTADFRSLNFSLLYNTIMAILGTNNSDIHFSADLIYPVGSIYLTMADTSPADLFGGT